MKFLIPAVVLSALLTGCSTSPQKLSNIEICEEAGKALYAHDGERFKELIVEAERRDALHLTGDIAGGKCKQYIQIGEMEAQQSQENRSRWANALKALNQSMQQQQAINNASRPVTTTCSGGYGSATCTTW